MKKYLDKLSSKIRITRSQFVFLLTIVIIGVTAGALFTAIISQNDKQLVITYLTDFFNNVKSNHLAYNNSLLNSLILSLGLALLVWLLGISVIGFIVVIIILFLKAFTLGFSVASIITVYKFKGLVYAFLYAFPHQIINIMIFILLSAFALIASVKIMRGITSKRPIDFKRYINKYLIVLGVCIFSLFITSLYEIYMVPKVLSFTMNFLKW